MRPYAHKGYAWPTKARQRPVDHVALEAELHLWHGPRMQQRNSRAGGFFLIAGTLTGTAWGIAAGNPMKGILIGTAVGIAIAVAVWVVDRRR